VITLLLILAGYAVIVAFSLALLTAARRSDELMGDRYTTEDPWPAGDVYRPAGAPPVESLPGHDALARLAADIHGALGVERVAVVVRDAGDPATGVVSARLGASGPLGDRVPLAAEAATGIAGDLDVGVLGVSDEADSQLPWRFARAPIPGGAGAVGTVTIAARRPREFTERELDFLGVLAKRAGPPLDRERVQRRPGEAA
jgi:hypothetical protein